MSRSTVTLGPAFAVQLGELLFSAATTFLDGVGTGMDSTTPLMTSLALVHGRSTDTERQLGDEVQRRLVRIPPPS